MPEGTWPGTAAMLAAVQTASEGEATLIGKPEPQLMITAVERLGDGRRTLVIGDRIDTDGAAAAAARLDFAIVLTGGADRAELQAAKDPLRPVAVAENLAELVGGGP